ncbi:MAG: TatD family hydrolase, partial [Victivallales bacterium]
MIPFTDAHTHCKAESAGVLALRNLAYPSERAHSSGNLLFSAGIHPYDVLTRKFESLKAYLLENRCSAVGECGLDRSIEI